MKRWLNSLADEWRYDRVELVLWALATLVTVAGIIACVIIIIMTTTTHIECTSNTSTSIEASIRVV